MDQIEARFPPIDASQMTPRQKEVADKIAGGPRGGLRGPFLALIHHPDLADVIQQVGEQLRFRSTLSKELIELAILVVARHWTCQVEWSIHARIARNQTELPASIVNAIQLGAIPAAMTDEQRIVHDFAVGTLNRGAPNDLVYQEAVARFGRPGVLDLITLCGYYSYIAMLLNTAQIRLPDGEAGELREKA